MDNLGDALSKEIYPKPGDPVYQYAMGHRGDKNHLIRLGTVKERLGEPWRYRIRLVTFMGINLSAYTVEHLPIKNRKFPFKRNAWLDVD